MKKSRSHFYAIVFSLALLTSFHAHGALVRFDFTGVVNESEIIDGPDQGLPLPGTPSSGSLIEGYYIFDTETPDTYAFPDPSPQYGLYLNSIKELQVNFGGLLYTFDLQSAGNSEIRTEDAVGGNVRDRYTTILREGSGDTYGGYIIGPALGSYVTSHFQFDIFDWEGGSDPDLLADDSLPQTPPDLALATDFLNLGDAALMPILMQYRDPDAGYVRAELRGQLTSLSLHTIPIPPALWLFGTGLLGLVGVARRKQG